MKQYQEEWLKQLTAATSTRDEVKVLMEIMCDDSGGTDPLTQQLARVAYSFYQETLIKEKHD